jgi:hypothetical protein
VSGDGEADLPEIVTPQNLGRMWASSVGLTSTVATDGDVLHTVVEWGSYDTKADPGARRAGACGLATVDAWRPRAPPGDTAAAVRLFGAVPPGRAAALW